MFALYLFAVVVGGALLLFSLFGSDSHDADASHVTDGQNPAQWLSLRAVMYFLFVFGGVGLVLASSWPAAAAPLAFLLALVTGAGVSAAVSATFAYIRRTNSGNRESDDSFVGSTGRMTVPFTDSGRGKVMVARGDRTFELLAHPFDAGTGDPARWQSVVVVEMRRGVAIVAPSDDPQVRELSLLNP